MGEFTTSRPDLALNRGPKRADHLGTVLLSDRRPTSATRLRLGLRSVAAGFVSLGMLALSCPVTAAASGSTAAAPGPAPAAVTLDWARPIVNGANVSMTSPVVVPQGSTPFVVTGDEGGNLRAFRLSDGSAVPGWGAVHAGFRLRAPLSTDGTNVYVPVAQDGKDRYPAFKKYGPGGSLIWTSNSGTSYGAASFLLAGMSLAEVGGAWQAFGASSGHWFYRVDAATGSKVWGFRNADSTMATPALADVLGTGSPQVITSNDKSPEFSTDKAGGHLRILTTGGRQICSADQLANGFTYASSGYNNSSPAVAEVAGHPLIVFGSTGPVQSGAGGNQIVGYDATCKLRWASAPLAAQANPSPTFADVSGDPTPEVIALVGVADGTSFYPRVYVLDARTGATVGDTGTSLRGFGAGHVRYTQASSVATADANGDGVQDLFVPASKLLVLDGATRQLIAQLDMGGTIQNTPVLTAEPGGGLRATIAGYSGNNGNGVSGGMARSWVFSGGTLGEGGWPRFGHDSQLTGRFGELAGPYDQLVEGQGLPSGGQLRARANGYTATMQPDGNLVLRRADGSSYWSSRTAGNPGATLSMTAHGNLLVRSTTGAVLWQSYATGTGVERLVLGIDGHLRTTSGSWFGSERTNIDRLLWSSKATDSIPKDHLYLGQELRAGQVLRSRNGVYTLSMQSDGNLVLRRSGTPRWATGTRDTSGKARLAMQSDGNLVLYGATRPLKSWGLVGRGSLFLELRDDGLLQVVNGGGASLWRVSGA